jgi:hypothetical protein
MRKIATNLTYLEKEYGARTLPRPDRRAAARLEDR